MGRVVSPGPPPTPSMHGHPFPTSSDLCPSTCVCPEALFPSGQRSAEIRAHPNDAGYLNRPCEGPSSKRRLVLWG